jgi:hypothetical protein
VDVDEKTIFQDNLNNYLKDNKTNLNDLLIQRLRKNETKLNLYRPKLVFTNNIFNLVSFKTFYSIIHENRKEISKLPLMTKIHLAEELDKINKRVKKMSVNTSILITPVFTASMTYYLFKNFSKDIRNKIKFFKLYLAVLPVFIFATTYALAKLSSTMYFLRRPIVDINNFLCDIENIKDNHNQTIQTFRHNFRLYVDDHIEYKKIIDDSKNNFDKTVGSFHFHYFNYVKLRFTLKKNISSEISRMKTYIKEMSRIEKNIIFEFYKTIIVHCVIENYSRNISKGNYDMEKSLKKPDQHEVLNLGIKNPEYLNFLNYLRNSHLKKSENSNQVISNIFYLDFLAKRLKTYSIIVQFFEMQYHIEYMKIHSISKLLTATNTLHKILNDDRDANQFYNDNLNLSQKYKEYFTIPQMQEIEKYKYNYDTLSNIFEIFLESYSISLLSSYLIFQFFKF